MDNMQLGKNIARNAALRENVFMMTVCIDLRIPLFLVGKPGSSKSLAKSIVSNSLLGNSSKSKLLKSFKKVCMNVDKFFTLLCTVNVACVHTVLVIYVCQLCFVSVCIIMLYYRFRCSLISVASCQHLRASSRYSIQPKVSKRRTPLHMCQWWYLMKLD